MKNIIILGGGQAGAYAAKEIRKNDTKSHLTIISEEKSLPYERPPLSKDFLLEKINFEKLLFFPNEFYKENKINVITDERITKVDFKNKYLISNKNNKFNYNKLLIATGSTNIKLQLENLDQVVSEEIIYLRDANDSRKIKKRLKLAKKIIIIGGGFIGLEIASAAAQLGKKVSVIEMAKQLMGRVIPVQIADIVQDIHEKKGNKFYLNTKIKKITKIDNSYEILLDTKVCLSADLIIVGIGSKPNTSIFINKDLKIDNGIITDEFCQTSIPDVYAAGDVSNFYHPFYKINMRLESFKHAQNHGNNAGKNISDVKTQYQEIPWMWSDQFNLNLQMTGICTNYESFIKRGNNIEEGIIYFFIKNRRIRGACGLGVGGKIGRDIRLAGKISEKNIKVTKEILSDRSIKLNKLLN